ncbi:oligopeptide transporter, OPT family [Sphingomonas sp. G-3-2-10]|uniref:OPT family oligopeptide transporter n=1 Tax=Sphingomonas sp. G-3-2-10 TaxID=2728838 RepID=UPI00146CB20C|nr:oligopeptide transporter, OPT family [Sphingomonas sp. G-3-2-10]NML06970.1 oligopeptide transporter, OPT family [Sphingomonas sp. G-3-2-10]
MATAPTRPIAEFTFRAILLGGLITILFTAANVYLGLKIGLTFATSIPAAVISMAILRFLPNSSILENNIVQTVASAAGTLAAIIFVLPGLVMIGWWSGFPYVTTAAITMTGGILGVMFSVPLRRALIVDSPELPYPEGRAAAEVLKVGAGSREGAEESSKGLTLIVVSSIVAAGFALITRMRLAVEEAATFFKVGSGATGVIGGLSFALIGAGHLIGLTVGFAMIVGIALGWWVALPILSAGVPGAAEEVASTIFRSEVRFLGAGTIGIAAIWTLLKIAGPVVGGIRSSLAASKAARGGEGIALTERDISARTVGLVSLAVMVPIAWLLWDVIAGGPLAASAIPLIAGSLLFVLVIGLVIAAVCGYMAGLVGASNSPVSGVGILAILASSLLLVAMFGRDVDPGTTQALIAYALIVTGVVFGVATISNDNLQDLKTGQLVGATPWKQQLALVFGVIFGSLVIPPVLSVLHASFGFAGMPGAGDSALAAPQAALISSLAKGVLGGDLDWNLIGVGALIGLGIIVIDEVLARVSKHRLPPLAVGLGIYLPMAVTLTVAVGAVLGYFYDRAADKARDPEFAKRMGVLMATGMIVGDSLFGVLYAGIVYETGTDAPLALAGPDFATYALVGGTLVFLALTAFLYAYTKKKAR